MSKKDEPNTIFKSIRPCWLLALLGSILSAIGTFLMINSVERVAESATGGRVYEANTLYILLVSFGLTVAVVSILVGIRSEINVNKEDQKPSSSKSKSKKEDSDDEVDDNQDDKPAKKTPKKKTKSKKTTKKSTKKTKKKAKK